MEIERSTTISCPRDTLFEYLREPNNDPAWCPTVHSSELTAGSTGQPGAEYHQVHRPGPFPPSDLEVTLLEVDEPDHIQLRSTDELGSFVVTYRLEDLGDGRTRVTQHDDIRLDGFARLLTPFMMLAVDSGIRRQFTELERMAQRGEIAPAA